MKLPGLTDSEIWSLFKKGDNRAFAQIYNDHSTRLYQYGLKFTSDHSLVEDAMHDLFTNLIRNRKTLGDTDNINYYLLKSMKRELVRKVQKAGRLDHVESPEGLDFNISWSVEQQIIQKETASQEAVMLSRALERLTYRQKEALYLRFSMELGYHQISEMMEISVEACRNLIHGALKSLKASVSCNGRMLFFFFSLPKRFQKSMWDEHPHV